MTTMAIESNNEKKRDFLEKVESFSKKGSIPKKALHFD